MADMIDLAGLLFPAVTPPQGAAPKTDRLPTEAQKLTQDLAQIRAANSNADAQALFNLSRQRGNELTANNQIANDFDTLSPIQFQGKYGRDAYEQMAATVIGGGEVSRLAATTKSVDQHIADTISQIGAGAIQAGLGIGQFAAQAIPGSLGDRLTTDIAKLSRSAQEYTDSKLTPEQRRLNYVNSLRSELDNIDAESADKSEQGEHSPLVSFLRSEGRKALHLGKRLMEDPTQLAQGVSEGVGSILALGPATRGLKVASTAVNEALSPTVGIAARAVNDAIGKAVFPLTVAGSEGGSNANQAIQDVLGQEDLDQQPEFKALVDAGLSPEAARLKLAANAGRVANALSAPVAALTGKLVEPLEMHPFSHTSPAGLAANAGKEFVEEAIQSGTGQLAGNVGKKVSGANPNQDLGEGVTESALEGGLAGAGSPVATQGPSVALSQAAKAAGIALKGTVGAGIKALKAKGEQVQADNEKQSTVSPESLAPVVEVAAQKAPEVADNLRTLATENGAKGDEIDTYIDKIQQASQVTPDELKDLPATLSTKIDEFQQETERLPNKFEALLLMANTAMDEAASQEDRTAAGAFLVRSIEDNQKLFSEDLPQFLEKVPQDREEYQAFDQYAGAIKSISQVPAVQQAMTWALTKMEMPDQDLSKVDLKSDEGQKIVNNAVNVAAVAPQAINPNVVDQIMHQADEGVIDLPPERRRILRTATALLDSARLEAALNRAPEPAKIESEAADLQQDLKPSQSRDELMDFIGRQIETEGGARRHQLSLVQHTTGIMQAVRQGDKTLARRRAQHLASFAKSQINKVGAINQSAANGNGQNVPYQAWDGTQFYTSKKGWGVRLNSDGSLNAARKVHGEAMAIAQLSNDIAKLYPEFGIQQYEVPALVFDKNQQVNKDNRGSSTAAAPQPSQATTSKTVEKATPKSEQMELPLPPPSETRAPEAPEASAAEETEDDATVPEGNVSTDQKTDQVEPEKTTEASAKVEPKVETKVEAKGPRILEDLTQDQKPAKLEVDADIDLTSEDIDTEEEPGIETKEAFPTLVQPKGKNFFQKAFRLPQQAKTRLLGLKAPMRDFYTILNQPRRLISFMGHDVEYNVTSQDRENLQSLLEVGTTVFGHMQSRLNDAMSAKSKDGSTLLEQLHEGKEVIRYRKNRALNILEKTENGYRYNPELVQSAIIASLDWFLNAADRTVPVTVQDVASMMDIDEGAAESYLEAFNDGVTLDTAKRALADNIVKFWGVSTNPNTSNAYTKGIPEAVAAEILHGMSKVGLLRLKTLNFPEVSKRDFNRVLFDDEVRPEAVNKLFDSLAGVRELFADMALVDRQPEGISVGKPIEEADRTQLHNPMAKTTRQNRKALLAAQSTPYHTNEMVADFIGAMGLEAFVKLQSKSDRPFKLSDLKKKHTEMGLNKQHWESVKGLQRSLASSYKHVQNHLAAVRKHHELSDKSDTSKRATLSSIPVYFKHHVNKLGRLQMAGLANPQVDKLAREIFMATRSTLDLSEHGSQDYLRFMKTVGQGIGLKTEKLTAQEVMASVEKTAMNEGGELYPLVQELKTWLDNRENKGSKTIPASTMDHLTKAGLSMHGIHSLLALAQYERTKDNGGNLKRFETFNSLEADGKTNGPINALMLFATGPITSAWLKAIGKGGVYFGQQGKTLNSHADKVDLYEEGANGTEIHMDQLGEKLAGHPEAHEMFLQLKLMLGALDANIVVDPSTGEITLKRGLVKNPLTITTYGSGAKGIAGKIAHEVVKALYEKLSDSHRNGKPAGDLIYGEGADLEFMTDLADLTSKELKKNEKGKYYVQGESREIPASTALDFELDPKRFNTLRANIQMMLVEPMREAIKDSVTQHVEQATTAVQKATQIQSIVLKTMFIREVASRVALMQADPEKYDYHAGDFLSDKDLDDILKTLLPFSPKISTGTQEYFLSGGEKSNLIEKVKINVGDKEFTVSQPEDFGRALTDDLRTPAYVYGPTLAGVRAIATLTVGSGDAQMMMNFLSEHPEAAKRVLHVFDGLNMPADEIEGYSALINKAVFDSWTKNTNPIRAVAESLRAFSDANPIGNVFPGGKVSEYQKTALTELSRVYFDSFTFDADKTLTPDDVQMMLEDTLRDLEDLADQADARRKTYSEFDASIDQMASGETPHSNQGSIQLDLDPNDPHFLDKLAEAMDKRYGENLAEIKARRARGQAEKDAIDRGSDFIDSQLVNFGSADGDTGARAMAPKDLGAFLKAISGSMNPTQKEMARNAIKLLEDTDYEIVFGSGEELRAWERSYNADRYAPDEKDFYGKIDLVSKKILIKNVSPETIVHELVHAATMSKVSAFYADPKQLTQEERDAVSRIEGMMHEWQELPYADEDTAGYYARKLVDNNISKFLDQDRKAEAVNEFMAWVLANQHLARMAQVTKIQNPILRIAKDVIEAIKSLIWGGPNKGPKIGDSILSNLRFNTRILMAMPSRIETLKQDSFTTTMYQDPSFGSDERLRALRQRFHSKVVNWINERASKDPVDKKRIDDRRQEADEARQSAEEIAAPFAYWFSGLNTMQGKSTFVEIQAALATEIRLDANALSRLEELYTHAISKINWWDFRENNIPGDQNDEYQAHAKFDVLHGLYVNKTDKHGRSSLLSSFLALAMVDDQFRKILANIEKPAQLKNDGRTLDAILENAGTAMWDKLSVRMSGEKNADRNVRDAIDSLVDTLVANTDDQTSFIEQKGENALEKLNNWMAFQIQDKSAKLEKKTSEVLKTSKSRTVKAGAAIANLAATIINEDSAEQAQLGLVSQMNRRGGMETVRALINDLVGETKENAPIFGMISKVRAAVQQTRQRYRDELPLKLAKAFTKPVSADEWSSLYKALGKTDLAALVRRLGVAGALDMISDRTRLTSEIGALEKAIRAADPQGANLMLTKSQQLAEFMLTGKHGLHLLRNAEAIARLLGERGYYGEPDPKTVQAIDELVTLYAIQKLDKATLDTSVRLLKSQKDGMHFITSYLVGQRVDELAKLRGPNRMALLNHYKGNIPSENQNGGSLIIASDSEHAKLVKRGYRRLDTYHGSSADISLGKRSYYFSPVSGTAPFSQGVLQTVHTTASGINPETGYTVGETTAGVIEDPRIVQLIDRRIRNQRATEENLLPVFNDRGHLVAYERAADVSKLTGLNRSTDLSKMIGVWSGRQVEELLANEVNKELIRKLHTIWTDHVKQGRQKEFVNIAQLGKDADPILREAARLIPKQTLDYVKEVFGPDEFWVRRDMLLDTFGARQASVGDLFTGQTRWNKKVQTEFEKLAMGIFGNKAYPTMVAIEKNLQEVVANMKTMIVVKSVVVPAANAISNMFQLVNRGVPVKAVIRGFGKKSAEINFYIKSRKREIDLEAELRAAEGKGDLTAIRKLGNQLQSLKDSYKRLTIWPLIEAGEFSAISNGNVTAEDLALADGKWTNFVERKVAALPDGIRTPVRYALVTRDTALFQGLARAVQYGDFVAKAILYDDLVHRKAKGREEAISTVSEAFVNYNRLTGRSRQYLESVGLLWFYNYKLRIMKEAAYTLRNNPLRSLLMTAVPSLPLIGDIGLPTADNIVALGLDGNLGWSIGPSMGLNSFHLNPWINLVK